MIAGGNAHSNEDDEHEANVEIVEELLNREDEWIIEYNTENEDSVAGFGYICDEAHEVWKEDFLDYVCDRLGDEVDNPKRAWEIILDKLNNGVYLLVGSATITRETNMNKKLEEMGFSMKPELVEDMFDGTDGCAHWKVTIYRGVDSIEAAYFMGPGHRTYKGKPLSGFSMWERRQSVPSKPSLAGVLYSLVKDAETVQYANDYAEWAFELGYDSDSISGRGLYYECLSTFARLSRLCNLTELIELFQDY